jgi:hypothetical protein
MYIPGLTILPPGVRKSMPSSSNLRMVPPISYDMWVSIYPINLSNFIIALPDHRQPLTASFLAGYNAWEGIAP